MIQINPIKYYEVNGVPCPLFTACSNQTAGTNRTILTGVSGKIIRVMGDKTQGIGAGGSILFKAGSGGSVIISHSVPDVAAGRPYDNPVIDAGYYELTSGVGLFADINTVSIDVQVSYIIYTPET